MAEAESFEILNPSISVTLPRKTLHNMQKAVITGSNGFVGSHLVDLLISEGFKVTCIVRRGSNLQWLKGKSIELAQCGLENVEDLKRVVHDADYVFHIAGVVNAPSTEGYFKGNVETTANILEACLTAKNLKKILVTSSMASAGPAEGAGKPLREDAPMLPINAYGRSKKEQEELCAQYFDRLPICIARPPAVYGPRDTEVLLFFSAIKKGIFPLLGLTGYKTFGFIYCKDLVKGMLDMVRSDKTAGQAYFLGSAREFTWKEVADVIGAELGKKATAIRIPHFVVYGVAAVSQVYSRLFGKKVDLDMERARLILCPSWYCSVEKAERDFGFKEEFSLDKAVKETVEWYKGNGWL